MRKLSSREQDHHNLHHFEELEPRQMMDVTRGDETGGWTVITHPAGALTIYVSSSIGSDSNDGRTALTPYKTLKKAKSQMRDGAPDWLLLRRGDTWNESFGVWTTSGQDEQNPQLISYYSDDPLDATAGNRPYINPVPTDSNGNPVPVDSTHTLPDGIAFGGTASHIAIVGLQFHANAYNGRNSNGMTGIRMQVSGSDYLVEDTLVQGFKDNMSIANPGKLTNHVTIRRSQSLDSYSAVAHSQGLYVSGLASDVLIEENVFDHNGWNDGVAGAEPVVFNHNMYINTGAQNVVVRGNIVTRGSLRGTLLRAGGVVQNNLYDRNPVAIQVGNTDSVVSGNVILNGVDLPSLPSGVGIDVAFSIPSADIHDNIIAHDQSNYTYNLSGINLNGGTNAANVQNNIVYDWRRTLINGSSGGATVTGNALEDFDGYHPLIKLSGSGGSYSSNRYFSDDPDRAFQEANNREDFGAWSAHRGDSSVYGDLVDYKDPNRDMATYNASLGGLNDWNAWIAAVRGQFNNLAWTSSYTAADAIDYIKDGFTAPDQPYSPNLPRVNVGATVANAAEPNTNVITDTGVKGQFTLTRTGSVDLPLTVQYRLSGTATNGSDYSVSPSLAVFPAGQSSIQISVNPKYDTASEGPETVKLRILASATFGAPAYAPGVDSVGTVTIADRTPPPPPPPPPPEDDGSEGGGSGGTIDIPPINNGTGGLTGLYYNNRDFSGNPAASVHNEQVNRDYGNSNPPPGLSVKDFFSVKWVGQVQPQYNQKYTFYAATDADAAVRILIEDDSGEWQTVVDHSPNHRPADANDDAVVNSLDFSALAAHFNQKTGGTWETGDFTGDGAVNLIDFNTLASAYGTADPRQPGEWSGTIDLEAGIHYNIQVEYSEKVGAASMIMSWSSASRGKELVPQARLFPSGTASPLNASSPSDSPAAELTLANLLGDSSSGDSSSPFDVVTATSNATTMPTSTTAAAAAAPVLASSASSASSATSLFSSTKIGSDGNTSTLSDVIA